MAKKRTFETIGNNNRVILLHDKIFPLYIVKGEKNFLIDSGALAKAAEFHRKIDTALETLGPDAAGAGRGIDTLLLTHTHWDHTGAAYYLQQIYGFNIKTSQRGVALLEKKKVISFIERLNQHYKEMQNDTSDTRCGELEKLEPVSDGDTIPVGDGYFEVIETPGHTRCSVAYMLHPERILFQGDTAGVLEQDGSIKPLFLSSYNEYENSLKKLIAAEAEVLAFPHNRFFKGRDKVRRFLEKSLARTQSVKEMVLELLKKEEDITKIAEIMYDREFPRPSLMGPKEAVMINFEAMVKTLQKEFPI
jgi:glyoxylase-like metal-dependent hydrolase (beta-lactamase superfamily II)